MFDNIVKFFKKLGKKEPEELSSKDMAKERLHLVLMQDRANVSADFLEMMKQEIIEVIKKYVDVDEKDIDVKLTNKTNEDGTTGAPALYANIPIAGIKQDIKPLEEKKESDQKVENNSESDLKEDLSKNEEKEEVVVEENNVDNTSDIGENKTPNEVNTDATEENETSKAEGENTKEKEESEKQKVEIKDEENEKENDNTDIKQVEEENKKETDTEKPKTEEKNSEDKEKIKKEAVTSEKK